MNIEKLLEKLNSWGCYAVWYPGCVEPRYEDVPIIAANWNHVPDNLSKQMDNALDASSFEREWSDEWTSCYDCGKAVRTVENSYSWRQSFVIFNDCELLCHKCVKCDIPAYLTHLTDLVSPIRADTLDLDLESLGLIEWNGRYESGFYPGQNDTPEKVIEEIHEKHPDAIVVFQIPSVGQFDIHFTAYYVENQKDWEIVLEAA